MLVNIKKTGKYYRQRIRNFGDLEMKIVFMGTPDFAVPSLGALVGAGHQLLAVITQPDRPGGRGKKTRPSPVKVMAQSLGLNVLQPGSIKEAAILEKLAELGPEVLVVVAFGQILPPQILSLPPRGCINVHASLLPRHRGAAPIHRAVMAGDSETGVTTMLMDQGLDTGDMLLQSSIAIGDAENVGSVHDRLAVLGGTLLLQTLEQMEKGTLTRVPQNNELASYAHMITKEDEVINWNKPCQEIVNTIRGLDPWPGACTMLGKKIIKIWQARPSESSRELLGEGSPKLPGTVLEGRNKLLVQTASEPVEILQVQIQGGRRLSARDFLRGHDIIPGTLLG